ncbi:sigma 54-interacting transcriptional regulator [Liquorilactobacillus ghanensis]|uniref:sigma 54-interacting transcriptional regulator n=1 Tax=Liquorilactobacillus ghanensis TaxID=399370 RepID=UPI0039ED6C01
MTRREKILQYLQSHSGTASTGLTTNEIAQALDILRSNVSKELNNLVRQQLVYKLKGRPVHYLPVTATKAVANPTMADHPQLEQAPTIGFAGQAKIDSFPTTEYDNRNVFDKMVGSHASLKSQVEQAKAALLYPPHGLNTLIIGPTGSGKTYFANTMYRFARAEGLIKDQEFATFNCADYAHNPQLLMSHLFGYVKGAFTGADEDKPGLIEQAAGGILFLDEVHRLPPEGQEMIFYFMDHGTYNRLGETAKTHHADVRLICATTENPESALLQTFVRRIPILIQLPPFNQRTPKEKLQLLEQLLTLEANRIHKNIRLNEDVVQALLGSVTYGNVGQLKSNIQLVCAQGFLNSIQDENEIILKFEQLPTNIKDGLSNLAGNREELGKLTRLLEPTMLIKPDAQRDVPQIDSYELPYNLYEVIGDKAALLKDEGLDQATINNFIMTDINLHLKSFYHQGQFNKAEDRLNEIVDQEIIDLTKQIQHFLRQQQYPVRENFIYAMSLHISSFIKRVQAGKPLREVSANLISLVHDYPAELKMAGQVKELIGKHYHIPIPESEVYYLAVLLASLQLAPKTGKVGIVVAAHGKSTATSMSQVVSQLLSVNNIAAFDMPLEMSPKSALLGIAQQVKKVDQGNGVLLLVDMGSLSTFSEKLTDMTNIQVKTIDMVTTAMVLEAARKTALIDSDLQTVSHELHEFDGYSRTPSGYENTPSVTETANETATDQRHKAIVAICSTGQGTAQKIKNMLDKLLIDNLIEDVSVIPISIVNMKERLKQIQQEYQIIATTGVTKPDIAAPFISLESLLQGGSEAFINMIDQLSGEDQSALMMLEDSPQVAEQLAEKYLGQYFTFINPAKIIKVLDSYCDFIERRQQLTLKNSFKLSLIMHLAGAIERCLTHSQMHVEQKQIAKLQNNQLFQIITQANDILRETLNLSLTAAETYYIYQLIDTEIQK